MAYFLLISSTVLDAQNFWQIFVLRKRTKNFADQIPLKVQVKDVDAFNTI